MNQLSDETSVFSSSKFGMEPQMYNSGSQTSVGWTQTLKSLTYAYVQLLSSVCMLSANFLDFIVRQTISAQILKQLSYCAMLRQGKWTYQWKICLMERLLLTYSDREWTGTWDGYLRNTIDKWRAEDYAMTKWWAQILYHTLICAWRRKWGHSKSFCFDSVLKEIEKMVNLRKVWYILYTGKEMTMNVRWLFFPLKAIDYWWAKWPRVSGMKVEFKTFILYLSISFW